LKDEVASDDNKSGSRRDSVQSNKSNKEEIVHAANEVSKYDELE